MHASRNSGPRLLLVEDDFLVASAIEEGLTEAGFRIVGSVGTAEEAVALARVKRPKLAIMDIRLRGARDGVDAAVEIYRASGVRSIFATAHYDQVTRARAQAAAPLGWLPKPYSVESLIALIREALEELRRQE